MKKALFTGMIVLLTMTFASAQGGSIRAWKLADLKQVLDSSKTPVVINFWATFCAPCLQEIPHFNAAMQDTALAKGVRFVFVSLDLPDAFPKSIRNVQTKKKMGGDVVWLNETDADLFCPVVDKSWSGAIPATLFYNPMTGYRKFVEEVLTPKALRQILTELIASR